ncbi:MAG: ABC transporter substrate-binding protein [Symploca sp. SIO3C6]|nr:ABC transporter substrate-binding protein [Symploca sp. SIO3C6]NET03333.1 ABC transporter substrate-binding protein [Symploca sp. SIO2B6]
MKLEKFLLPLGIIGLVVVSFFAYSSIAAPLPAGFPPPTADGEIEVKQYPAYRAATVRYSGELSQAANSSFNPLYSHISSNDISMTAPVETRYPASTLEAGEMGSEDEQGEAYVSFLYRNTEVYPEQVSQNIQVEDIQPMMVVSLGLKGSYSYSSYQQNIKQLQSWLAQHPEYEVVGLPRRFFYDAPFVPEALKRSEIQIPIRIQDN